MENRIFFFFSKIQRLWLQFLANSSPLLSTSRSSNVCVCNRVRVTKAASHKLISQVWQRQHTSTESGEWDFYSWSQQYLPFYHLSSDCNYSSQLHSIFLAYAHRTAHTHANRLERDKTHRHHMREFQWPQRIFFFRSGFLCAHDFSVFRFLLDHRRCCASDVYQGLCHRMAETSQNCSRHKEREAEGGEGGGRDKAIDSREISRLQFTVRSWSLLKFG